MLPIRIFTKTCRNQIFMLSLLTLLVSTAQAQPYPQRDSYRGDAEFVTVYEDCGFRGKSRALAIGEYGDIRKLNLGNDAISSVRVPRGMQIVLFEHERLRGSSTSITSDVACLNREWNDQASSLEVTGNSQYQPGGRYGNHSDYRGGNDWQNEDGRASSRNNRNGERWGGAQSNRDLTKDITYVSYAGAALEMGRGGVWRSVAQNGTVVTYKEQRRDNQRIYLRGNQFDMNIEIDLADRNVRFTGIRGRDLVYPITSAEKRPLAATRPNQAEVGPNRRINASCFTYKAYTDGGEGGIRFHGHDGFDTFARRGTSDRICHNGALTMELNKKDASTTVTVEINGERFRFAANEEPDVYLNTWYRKKITLVVGK